MSSLGCTSRSGVVLLAASIAAVCSQRPPVSSHGGPALAACTVGTVAAQCGSIEVYENRVTRQGRRLDIRFAVVRGDAGPAHEAVFVFAGGPGEGSVSLAAAANGWTRPLRATADLVYVDQRGTGRSHPLPCPSAAADDPPAAFGHVFDPAAVARCRATLDRDADLTQYTTDIAAADVDDVRTALGYEKIALYGQSYGTRLAQAYLRRYPSHARSVVLDGAVPPDLVIPLTYAASAQQSLARVFAACTADAACNAAHPRVAADFETLLRRFDAGPIVATVTTRDGTRVAVKVSRGDFAYAVRGLLYYSNAVVRLPDLIREAVASGSVDAFAQAYLTRALNIDQAVALGLHLSVFCAEDLPFATKKDADAASAGTFMGRYLFDEYASACSNWPQGQISPDTRTPVTSAVPTLIVSGFFDPVTPPSFGEQIARSLPLARTIVAERGSHGSVFECPRAAALAVLEHGTLDDVPVTCS